MQNVKQKPEIQLKNQSDSEYILEISPIQLWYLHQTLYRDPQKMAQKLKLDHTQNDTH